MAKRPTRLPALTSMESVKEALDVRLGRRGDSKDAAVTFRDLEESGAFKFTPRGGRSGSGGSLTPLPPDSGPEMPDWMGDGEDTDTWVPPNPKGFTATAMFGGIFVEWDWPEKYGIINQTEIYRAASNRAEDRKLLAVESGLTYFDTIDGQDETEYFYWVRFRSIGDIVGPYSGPVSAVSVPRVEEIIDRIEGEITESELADALEERIDKIEPLERDVTDLETGLYEEVQERKSEDRQIIESVDRQVANLEGSISSVSQTVTTEVSRLDGRITATSRKVDSVQSHVDKGLAAVRSDMRSEVRQLENGISAVSSKADTVQSNLDSGISSVRSDMRSRARTVDGKFRGVASDISQVETRANNKTAAVRQDMKAEIDEVEGTVDSLYTLRVQSGDKIAGFGLSNNGSCSDFTVIADRFAIVNNYGSHKTSPFFVSGRSVYMRDALIQNASIDSAKIRDGAINNAKIANASIDFAKISNVKISSADIKRGAIGSAQIGYAAVGSAEIGHAAVDTLELADNAVTVPVSISGTYSASVRMHAPVSMDAVVIGVFTQGQGRDGLEVSLAHNGRGFRHEIPIEGTTGAMAGTRSLSRGTHTFKIYADDYRGDMNCNITVLGIKR